MAKDTSSTQGPVAPTVVRPVVNAIGLLRHLGGTGTPASVTQLARLTGINTSTCFNILRTLVAEGLLVFDEETKTYQIGIGAIEIAQSALNEGGKADVFQPIVDAVARRHGVTLTLWRCGETHRHLMVGAAETELPFRIDMRIGLETPLFVGAIGRCFVTERGLTEAEIDALYPSLTWARPPGLEAFKVEVAEAAARGWGLDSGAFAKGVTNVGVIVPRAHGPARYGLVASLFQGAFSSADLDALAQDMIALGEQISGLD
ncbi:MAG: IclR family transcriptional regulator [Octadecabacter sp.]|nr:IclR family transcriptional regulator [Octadecabacter sp.]